MIRPLRVRHRSAFAVLAVLLPLLFVAGLLARRPIPETAGFSIERGQELRRDGEILAVDEDAWGGLPIRTEWLRSTGAVEGSAVRLELTGPLKLPDMLLYWDPDASAGSRLSDDAHLLGGVGARRSGSWDVPTGGRPGRLVLYSLARHEVVATATPPAGWGVSP